MTTLDLWIHISMTVLKDSSDKLTEYLDVGDLEGARIQNETIKKQIVSYIGYIEGKEKFG